MKIGDLMKVCVLFLGLTSLQLFFIEVCLSPFLKFLLVHNDFQFFHRAMHLVIVYSCPNMHTSRSS